MIIINDPDGLRPYKFIEMIIIIQQCIEIIQQLKYIYFIYFTAIYRNDNNCTAIIAVPVLLFFCHCALYITP